MASAPETKLSDTDSPEAGSSFINHFYEVLSPVNLLITTILFVLISYYKIYAKFTKVPVDVPAVELPKIRKDMTVSELRQYDGNQADGRVLVAVNGWIFDVTRGRRFYGPEKVNKAKPLTVGGPYAAFGGKDASRGLATFSVTSSDKEYDDLSDLNSMEMESVKEWEEQFREKYELVGRLLKPGEEPRNYSDEEHEETDTSTNTPEDEKKEQ